MIGRIRAALAGGDQFTGSPPFVELVRRFGLAYLDRQLQLEHVAGAADWWVDQGAGTISLGDLVARVQFVGSEAERPRSWMWAWANPNVHKPLTAAVQAMRSLGERDGVPELTTAEFTLKGALTGHLISLVAAGLADAAAYYRAPYPGGAAFVLLADRDAVPTSSLSPLQRAHAAVSTASLSIPVPLGEREVTAYLHSLELNPSRVDQSVVASDGIHELKIRFDNVGRIAEVAADFNL